MLVTADAWMAVVPLTLRVPRSLRSSPLSLPNTASPVTVRLWLVPAMPLTVPPVVMVVPVSVVSAPRVRFSRYCCVPVVVTLPPSRRTEPAASVSTLAAVTVWLNKVWPPLLTVRSPSAATLPSASLKLTLPVPDEMVRSWARVSRLPSTAESTVPENVTLPAPVPVDMARSPARVTADWKLMSALPVVMSPARVLLPTPFWVKAPVEVMSPNANVLNVPALVMVVVPPTLAAAFTARSWPVKVRSPPRLATSFTVRSLPVKARLPDRFTAPPRVVVPLPACWVKMAASTAARVTSFAETTFTAPSAAVPPTAPDTVRLPVPAATVRSLASAPSESTDAPKLTSLLVVVSVVSLPTITAPV